MGGALFGDMMFRDFGDISAEYRPPGGPSIGMPVERPGPDIGRPVEPQQPQPGYQLPTPQQPQQQRGYGEYYQQMRQGIESLDKVLKELEGMQTPGGQYNPGPGAPSFGPAIGPVGK